MSDISQISADPEILKILQGLRDDIDKDKLNFGRIKDNPELEPIQLEVDLLLRMVMQEGREKAYTEQKLLEKAILLLDDWKNDPDLKDIIIADRNYTKQNHEKMALIRTYSGWVDMTEETHKNRQRFLNKYQGYFQSQIKGFEESKGETQNQLAQAAHNSSHYKAQAESLSKVYAQVVPYTRKATTAMLGAFGLMSGCCLIGWLYGRWWGLLAGIMMGNLVFNYFMQNYAFVRGIGAQELYDSIKMYYDDKTLQKFFRPYSKIAVIGFDIFDASKGDTLLKLLNKDIGYGEGQHQLLERKKEEYINHLRYLDGRIDWMTEQCLKIKGASNLTRETAQAKAVTAEKMLTNTTESQSL